MIVPISKRIRSLLKTGFHGNFAVIEDIEGDDMQNWTQEHIEQLNRIQRGELDGGCTCRDAPESACTSEAESKGSQSALALASADQQGLQGHPRTCPNRSITPHHDNGREIGCLLATKDGWVCPDCGYTEGVLSDPSPEPLSATDRLVLGA